MSPSAVANEDSGASSQPAPSGSSFGAAGPGALTPPSGRSNNDETPAAATAGASNNQPHRGSAAAG